MWKFITYLYRTFNYLVFIIQLIFRTKIKRLNLCGRIEEEKTLTKPQKNIKKG